MIPFACFLFGVLIGICISTIVAFWSMDEFK